MINRYFLYEDENIDVEEVANNAAKLQKKAIDKNISELEIELNKTLKSAIRNVEGEMTTGKKFQHANLLIEGPPGIGKSEIISDWARSNNIKLITITGAQLSEEMVQGVLAKNEVSNTEAEDKLRATLGDKGFEELLLKEAEADRGKATLTRKEKEDLKSLRKTVASYFSTDFFASLDTSKSTSSDDNTVKRSRHGFKLSRNKENKKSPTYSVLFIDELNRSPSYLRAAILDMIQSHSISDSSTEEKRRKIKSWLLTVAAINPSDENKGITGTEPLDLAMITRFRKFVWKPTIIESKKYLTKLLDTILADLKEKYKLISGARKNDSELDEIMPKGMYNSFNRFLDRLEDSDSAYEDFFGNSNIDEDDLVDIAINWLVKEQIVPNFGRQKIIEKLFDNISENKSYDEDGKEKTPSGALYFTPDDELGDAVSKQEGVLNARTFTSALFECDGTKEDFLRVFPGWCGIKQEALVKQLLTDFKDVDDSMVDAYLEDTEFKPEDARDIAKEDIEKIKQSGRKNEIVEIDPDNAKEGDGNQDPVLSDEEKKEKNKQLAQSGNRVAGLGTVNDISLMALAEHLGIKQEWTDFVNNGYKF